MDFHPEYEQINSFISKHVHFMSANSKVTLEYTSLWEMRTRQSPVTFEALDVKKIKIGLIPPRCCSCVH